MTPPSAPPRRWFSYSLRTLFVVVTAFCVWLGVQVKWIRDRHEAMGKHIGLEAYIVGVDDRDGIHFYMQHEKCDAPWSIRILGEKGIGTIFIGPPRGKGPPSYVNNSKVREIVREKMRLRDLFPEAAAVLMTPTAVIWEP